MNSSKDLYIKFVFNSQQRYLIINTDQSYAATFKRILTSYQIKDDDFDKYVITAEPGGEVIINTSQFKEGEHYRVLKVEVGE